MLMAALATINSEKKYRIYKFDVLAMAGLITDMQISIIPTAKVSNTCEQGNQQLSEG